MKAYRDAAGYRRIPIGYSHADVAGLRPVLQNYLACGDSAQAIDFFGLNAYEWYETTGKQAKTANSALIARIGVVILASSNLDMQTSSIKPSTTPCPSSCLRLVVSSLSPDSSRIRLLFSVKWLAHGAVPLSTNGSRNPTTTV